MPDVFAGRFELIDPIGSGGTGTVWRAWDRRLERLCAAKVLRQRHAGALLRFVREQGLRLDHPHVLSPYSWAADDDQALLAMDLVDGGSVSNLLADFGGLPDRYAAELLAQLLAGLAQVHAAGLVHRDVKPANLLLQATGTDAPVLRLTDFGIALSVGEPRLTQHGSVVGTPGYIAPEILAGEPPSTAQDLYAAGVTAWQLLTGEDPPPGATPLPPAPSPLWPVVAALLDPDPTTRTPSAEAALAALTPHLATPLPIPSHTPDGEPIEVFTHLPPPPAQYADAPRPSNRAHAADGATRPPSAASGSSGASSPGRSAEPAGSSPANASQPSSVASAASAGRAALGSEPGPGQLAPAAKDAAGASAARRERTGSDGPEPRLGQFVPASERAEDSSGSFPNASAPARATGADGRSGAVVAHAPTRHLRRLVMVGAGVLVAGVIAVVASTLGPDDGGGTPSPGTSVSQPGASASESPRTSASETPSPAPEPIPTGPVTRVPNPSVVLNATCGWQEAGSVETTADGTRVECRQQGASYRWLRAG
ncbi:serine/threonine protein kinase [Kribbella flavida DSM 17836]|uniref:non-specific serine/threonine protein kinase n=1 Tax=Kribbella flavida (strain DSM 17836 / JCM 10339 / NBRC 14399) TaxID=479435 RepID=D2PMF7_KRIFD|nr:serine/threonine-protein kinase [Kribbella flavida]ADB30701.1 serine/threonine protein kinase [Kribbella flavida DSM 17836]